jgi:Na+-translocating ferredoxin:NAD+ oxidoreductase subunit C
VSWFTKLLSTDSSVRTYSTPGGIKPKRYKSASLRSRIMPMPLPKQLVLDLRQYDGLYLKPCVELGESVKKYQIIADPCSPFGLPMYAPTSGLITAIETQLPSNKAYLQTPHLIIEPDGLETELSARAATDLETASQSDIISAVETFAIGGLGGAGFPTALKLKQSLKSDVKTLLINGAECEPFISCDEALMREHADEIVAGCLFLTKAAKAATCVIAIESHKKEAIKAIKHAIIGQDIKLAIVASKYPAGSEKQLIQSVTGKKIPAGSKPIDAGILVLNVGTVYSAYTSLTTGQPNITRITTLSGKPLRTPKNFEVLYGTPISFLLEICGVEKSEHTQTIIGGPLMGAPLQNGNAGITRTSNCIIAADVKTFPEAAAELACIRCGFCADACPVKLLPQQLYSFARSQNLEQLQSYQLNACIECGACSYVCPSKIPLVDYFKAGKAALAENAIKTAQSAEWQKRFQSRQIRLKTEKDAVLNKRKIKTLKSNDRVATAPMSRAAAQSEIAAAVARVRKKKNKFNPAKETD